MEIFLPRFPLKRGGNPIRFLRVVRSGEICAVAYIPEQLIKTGEVIAACKIKRTCEGIYSFITEPGDVGHEDLCILLKRQGINGNYRDWLGAVEAGLDQAAERTRQFAVISFELDPIDEEESSTWRIN